MNIDKEPPNAEDPGTLERGFARVMQAVANADTRERERLLRIADSADRAHDAYARTKKSDQDNAADHLLRLADAYSAAGTQDLDQRPATPGPAANTCIPDADGAQPAADPSALATMSDDPPEPPEPLELFDVHADDEYLDALSGADLDGDPDDDIGDRALTQLLMSWRRDVDSEPIDRLVDTKLAAVTVHAARMRRKRRARLLVAIAAAAAVLAIAFAGVSLAARDAQPGDTLWGITKVLYADHARSVEAARAVKDNLREAKAALTEGNIEEAKSKIEDAHVTLPTVLPDDGQNYLHAQLVALEASLPK